MNYSPMKLNQVFHNFFSIPIKSLPVTWSIIEDKKDINK